MKTSFAAQIPNNLIFCFEKGVNFLPGVFAVDVPKWVEFKALLKQLEKDEIKQKFISLYEKSLEKDLSLGYTTIGPHRDDIKVLVNETDVKSFGSQGQQRTAALSLKLAEIEIIKSQTGEMPILILDDVLSELDKSRRERLLKFCSLTQTFISSTDKPERIPNATVIKIENAKRI